MKLLSFAWWSKVRDPDVHIEDGRGLEEQTQGESACEPHEGISLPLLCGRASDPLED